MYYNFKKASCSFGLPDQGGTQSGVAVGQTGGLVLIGRSVGTGNGFGVGSAAGTGTGTGTGAGTGTGTGTGAGFVTRQQPQTSPFLLYPDAGTQ